MGIGKDIQRELDRRKWTPYRLGKESGIKDGTIRAIITEDRDPWISTVVELAKGFGITVDELVNNPKPTPRIRAKPKEIKDVRQCLEELGLGGDEADDIIVLVKHKLERQKAKGRATA